MVGSYCLDCKKKLRDATTKAIAEGFAEGYNEGEGKSSFTFLDSGGPITPEEIIQEIERGYKTNEDFDKEELE